MSELLSMLVPLETLPGWPAAPNPPVLATLGLLVGVPVVGFLVVYGIGFLTEIAKRGRGDTAEVGDPLWLGSRPEVQGTSSAAALEAGPAATEQTTSTGGASGRW